MNISKDDLTKEYQRANASWPFVHDVNDSHRLPPCLLFGVASRETNMRNVRGDNGHGHGMFQLDDRWHTIPPGFDQDVYAQATKAAQMLSGFYDRFGTWTRACNAYNSGKPDTSATTGHDYGPDVMERQAFLVTLHRVDAPLTDADISKLLNAVIDMGGGERATVAQMLSRTYRSVGLARDFHSLAFSSLSHGTLPGNVGRNGQGLDQILERLTRIEAHLAMAPDPGQP